MALCAAQPAPGVTAALVTYQDAHPTYRAHGWVGAIPLRPGTKDAPPAGFTGWTGVDPSFADCMEFDQLRAYEGTTQTALRMLPTTVGIDVDAYGAKTGAAALAEAERRWGPLPAAPWSSARDDGTSGIRFLRIPAGVVLVGKLDNTVGVGGIEIVQRHHRYAVVWPSFHPLTGTGYTWRGTAGPDVPPAVDELPELPAAWVEGLRSDAGPGAGTATTEGVHAFMARHTEDDGSGSVRGVLAVFARDVDRMGSRHDALIAAQCMAAREARAGRHSAQIAHDALQEAFIVAMAQARDGQRLVSPDRARAEFASGWAHAVAQAEAEPMESIRARKSIGGSLMPKSAGLLVAVPEVSAVAEPSDEADHPLGSWTPVDLGPYLRGEIVRPEPSVGASRTDGVHFLYPGKEHACIAEMEGGKSWFALACSVAELEKGNRVLYVHFEESDPGDTIERLRLLGLSAARITAGFDFVGPETPITQSVVDHFAEIPPTLVVLDGQNEAMALHGQGIRDEDGAAAYRARLVKPFTRLGAAVLSLDHVVKDSEKSAKGYALGSIHKGNGLSGSLIMLENEEPFGEGRRGASRIFITKDRPGRIRKHGRPTNVPRKFLLGVMSLDAEQPGRVALTIWPQRDEVASDATADELDPAAELAAQVLAVVGDLTDGDDGDGWARGPDITSRISTRRAAALQALDGLVRAGALHRRMDGRTHTFRIPPDGSQDH